MLADDQKSSTPASSRSDPKYSGCMSRYRLRRFLTLIDSDIGTSRSAALCCSRFSPHSAILGHWGEQRVILVHAGSDHLHKRRGNPVWTKTCSSTSLVPPNLALVTSPITL